MSRIRKLQQTLNPKKNWSFDFDDEQVYLKLQLTDVKNP